MKLNKKGFTLVELLAVIVLLALVAVVGANLIIARLNTAKKDTFANTYLGVKKELNAQLISGTFDSTVCSTSSNSCARAFDISANDFSLTITPPTSTTAAYTITLTGKDGGSYATLSFANDDERAKYRNKAGASGSSANGASPLMLTGTVAY